MEINKKILYLPSINIKELRRGKSIPNILPRFLPNQLSLALLLLSAAAAANSLHNLGASSFGILNTTKSNPPSSPGAPLRARKSSKSILFSHSYTWNFLLLFSFSFSFSFLFFLDDLGLGAMTEGKAFQSHSTMSL